MDMTIEPAPGIVLMQGDCLEVLAEFPDDFFQLIVTSPPYADSRSKTVQRGQDQ